MLVIRTPVARRQLEGTVDPLFRRVGIKLDQGKMSDSDLYGEDIRLLAAVAALGLGVAPAFAADNASGYVHPDFWGTQAAQQAPASAGKAPVQANGPTAGIYVTQSSHGTWLFPPNPNQGGNS